MIVREDFVTCVLCETPILYCEAAHQPTCPEACQKTAHGIQRDYRDVRVRLSDGTKTRIPCCEAHLDAVLDPSRWEDIMGILQVLPDNAHLRDRFIAETDGNMRRGDDWGQDGEVVFVKRNGTVERQVLPRHDGTT